MTKREAIKAGEKAAAAAKKNLGGANLAAWAQEQGLKSDAAAARGDEVEAARYAAAYVMASR